MNLSLAASTTNGMCFSAAAPVGRVALAGRALTRFQTFHSQGVIWARSSGVRTCTMLLTSTECSSAKTRAIVPLKECAIVDAAILAC
jgi:hypothetical protein